MSSSSQRYNKFHGSKKCECCKYIKNIKFYLEDIELEYDECRLLLLKIIERAKNDIIVFMNQESKYAKENWESARDFLFNDEYYIDWGGEELNFIHISQILDLDPDWERKKILKEIQTKAKGKLNDNKKRKTRSTNRGTTNKSNPS